MMATGWNPGADVDPAQFYSQVCGIADEAGGFSRFVNGKAA
jgi:hypothetical protein